MRWETKWKKNEILRKTTILVRKNKKTALTTSQLKNFTPHTIFHFTAAWCRIAIFFHRKKNSNCENKLGLYRYSKRRIRRLMRWLECTLGTEEIDWTICFASRHRVDFIRSCHIQLIKEGHEITNLSNEEFTQTSNFSYADPSKLIDELSSLKKNRKIN